MRRRGTHQSWQTVMDEGEMRALADYNSERARGLMHTPEYADRMATLQRAFDEARHATHDECGPHGCWVRP